MTTDYDERRRDSTVGNYIGIVHFNRSDSQPAVVYFHPWEIDPDQPRLPAGRLSRFRHYTNLGRMETRLRKLLARFSFGPIRQVYAVDLSQQDDDQTGELLKVS